VNQSSSKYAAVVVNDLWLFDQNNRRILAKAVAPKSKSQVVEVVPPPGVEIDTPVVPPKPIPVERLCN